MIIVRDGKIRLPFSRGILTRSITSAGVDVGVAYALSTEIMKELEREGVREVTTDEIMRRTHRKLREYGYAREARRYVFWSEVRKTGLPIIILIGGTTGVGKSTIATELAFRLGMRSIIGTDTIREVMRRMVSEELIPTIHQSSFLAWKAIKAPLKGVSPVIYGFERQVSHVSVGIKALMGRARKEGFNTAIEGVHVVPGYIPLDEMSFPYIITVEDRKALEARFYARERYSKRPAEYYLQHIEAIMEIQEFIVERAGEHGVPVVENVEVEETVNLIMEDLMKRLTEVLKNRGVEMEGLE